MIRPFLFIALLAGCAQEDPKDTAGGGEGECVPLGATDGLPDDVVAADACERADDDFPGDGWQACVSDEGAWVLVGDETPSSAARVAAYEAIGDLLWNNECIPTSEEFIQAQGIYGEDGGVGSRVTRRYDAHLTPPDGADCKADDAGDRWPDYCVGPGRIEPMILEAFSKGIAGEDPSANASAVRSGLLWFYFVSTYKEAFTCASTAKDCDSAWAYLTGGKQRTDVQLGLAGELMRRHPAVFKAVFDALLAVRCWRDLDPAALAEDDDLHRRALAQLDRALNRAWEVLRVPDIVPVVDACK